MCEGKTYDDKSDIWALGCIVYEMACLQVSYHSYHKIHFVVNKYDILIICEITHYIFIHYASYFFTNSKSQENV